MPLYEYKCAKCGSVFEKIEKFSDAPLKTHDANGCGGRVVRLLGAPAFHFKGSGWYVTDYGKGGDKTKVAGKNGEAVAAKENGKSAESTGKTATSVPAAAPAASPAPASGDKK
jgi:putative FmdB family regulatory protein